MKAIILAVAALASGICVGCLATWWEFAGEQLPSDQLAVRDVSNRPAAGSPALGPRLQIVGGEVYDFGKMDRYTSQTHEFLVRNTGDSDLTLVKGETTCKCTQFELERDRIAPGESAQITLKWEAKTTEADFQQSAELSTNDPQRRKVRLVVSGRVVDAVRAERSDLVVNTISANEDSTFTLKLFAYRSDMLNVEKVDLSNTDLADFFDVRFEPLATAEIAKERDAAAGLLMVVTIKSGLPLGSISQTIRLTTGQQPAALEIPVVGKVVSDISLAGPRLDSDLGLLTLGTVEQAQGTKVTIFVLVKGPHRDETQLKVAAVEPESNLVATLKPSADNPKFKRYALTVEVPPGSPSVSRLATGQLGKIVLETTHPLVKQVIVNVRFAVKD